MELDITEDLVELWEVNPVGAILLHKKGKCLSLFQNKKEMFIGCTDWAWFMNDKGEMTAGIGGCLVDNNGNIVFIFSGPSDAKCAYEAELDAAKFLYREFMGSMFSDQSLRICKDCQKVVNTFFSEKLGLTKTSEHKCYRNLFRSTQEDSKMS